MDKLFQLDEVLTFGQDFFGQLWGNKLILLNYLLEYLINMGVFIVVVYVVYKSVKVCFALKRNIFKGNYSRRRKLILDKLASLYCAHAVWALSLYFSQMHWADYSHYFEHHWINYLFLGLVAFRLLQLFSVYIIQEAFVSVGKFTNKKTFAELKKSSRKSALTVGVLVVVNAIASSFIGWSIAYAVVLLLIMCIGYLSLLSIVNDFASDVDNFIAKQLPSVMVESLAKKTGRSQRHLRLLLCLISHFIHWLILVHLLALRSDSYKTFATRMLWLRLEQKQQETHEVAEMDQGYERWFSTDYVPSQFVKQKDTTRFTENFMTHIQQWSEQKSPENNLLLVGPKGGGKSTLLRSWYALLEEKYKNNLEDSEEAATENADENSGNIIEPKTEVINTYSLVVPEKTITEGAFYSMLAQAFDANISDQAGLQAWASGQEKTVILLDDCHNLFLSRMGGFENYKELLHCISAGLDNIFWVVVLNTESEIYIEDVFEERHQFYQVFELASWSVEEIRELILNRHKSSKRKLVYDELLYSGFGNDELSSHVASEERCFTLLWEQSSGNPRLALSIWMNEAQKKERFTIEMGLTERPSAAFLSSFSIDHLFVYASLAKHESLTVKEAADATRLSVDVVQQAMKLGKDKGFLQSTSGWRYAMHPLWALSLTNFLKGKNYLHGK